MELIAFYLYGFVDYNNSFAFTQEELQEIDIELQVGCGIVDENKKFKELCYGFEIEPGTTATVEQKKKITEVVKFLKNKYKNTENLEIGYYSGIGCLQLSLGLTDLKPYEKK